MTDAALKVVYIILLIAILSILYFVITRSSLAGLFANPDLLLAKLKDLVIFGPLLVIGLMAIAIVINPLPSAPVALASGAVFGHTLGTLYVVIGAEIGAIMAFLIARTVGYDLVKKFTGTALIPGRFGSQNALTIIVFISRLVPFMSFDLVSYAAGLTVIRFWRFALATLMGLVPISFALAHMGSEMVDADTQKLMIIFLIIVLLMSIPLVLSIIWPRKTGGFGDPGDSDKST